MQISSCVALLLAIALLLCPSVINAQWTLGPGGTFTDFQSAFNMLNNNITNSHSSNDLTLTITDAGPFYVSGSLPNIISSHFTGSLTLRSTSTSITQLICTTASLTLPAFQFGPNGGNLWTLNIQNIEFVNCSFYVSTGGSFTLDSVRLTSCLASNNYPAMNLVNQNQVTITNSVFQNCGCVSGSSCNPRQVLFIQATSSAHRNNVIVNSQFLDNVMPQATAIITAGDDLRIINSEISGCKAKTIVSTQIRGGTLTQLLSFEGTYIHNNEALQSGVISIGSGAPNHANVTISGQSRITQNIVDPYIDGNSVLLVSGTNVLVIEPMAFIGQNLQDGILCDQSGLILNPSGGSLCGYNNNQSCPAGQSFDRCLTCGGTSVCLGCNNQPYGPTDCSSPVAVIQANTSTGSNGSVAVWQTGAPNPVLQPPGSSQHAMNITCGTIQEVTPSGTIVANTAIDMTTMPWYVTEEYTSTSYTRNFQYWATSGPSTYIVLSETLYGDSASVQSGDVLFTVGSNSLKLSLHVNNWPWTNPANSLMAELSFTLSEPSLSQTTTQVSTSNGFYITNILVDTPNTQVTINLQEFAVVDNVTQTIKVNTLPPTSTSETFQFIFPHFSQSLEYDPDFGVLLQSNAGSTTGGDGGSSNTGLIAGLAGGLGGFALLVVLVTVLLAILFGWWKVFRHDLITKRRSSSMVNFDPAEEDLEGSSSE